jgi:hypothetical protein
VTLPQHTAVRCVEEGHEYEGVVCFVHRTEGEVTMDGVEIPPGWVEVVFDPHATPGSGFDTELMREDSLCVTGC